MVVICFTILLLSLFEYGSSQLSCRPEITDFSRIHNFINWNAPRCSNDLQATEYQISLSEDSGLQVLIYSTNMTSTPSSCAIANSSLCYFRVRAELDDGSQSSYSACLSISNHIYEKQVSTEVYLDTCFQVTGVCSDGFTPSQYRINGMVPNVNDYNFTYISGSGFILCLKNVSRMIVVTERCEFIAARNHFCFPGVSVLTFLSRTVVNPQQSKQSTTGELLIYWPSTTEYVQSVFTSTNMTLSSVYLINQQPTDVGTKVIINSRTNSFFAWITVSLVIPLVLFFIIISTVLVVFYYRKNKISRASLEPVYDTIQPQNQNASLETKPNEAYLSLSRINMKSCPAYTTHRQIY